MTMKQHILAALREMLDLWEAFIAGLNDDDIATPLAPSHLTIKDVVAHLNAWQQRSLARVEAARLGCEPAMPLWPPQVDPDTESDVDAVNAWIYKANRDRPWPEVRRQWRGCYERLLESAMAVSEKDMLDAGRYPWLNRYPLVWILLATYDHHRGHLDIARTRLAKLRG